MLLYLHFQVQLVVVVVCVCLFFYHEFMSHVVLYMFHETTRQIEGRKEMFELTTHSTHFNYGYIASNTR